MSKTRKRISPIWLLEETKFVTLVKNSSSLKEVISYFGLVTHGSNYTTLNQRIAHLNLDITHIRNSNRSRIKNVTAKSDSEVFVENSRYRSSELYSRLLKYKNLECEICKLTPIWNNSFLRLQVDHINGVSTDNRLENLRFVCPNCHSQTATFSGKNCKKYNRCMDCQKIVFKTSLRCSSCALIETKRKKREEKGIFVEAMDLQKLVWEKATRQIAIDLGVSDTCVGKWCKKLNITKPPRGYWNKKYVGKI